MQGDITCNECASQCATKKHCLFKHASQCATKKHCVIGSFLGAYHFFRRSKMIEKGLYYTTEDFAKMIKSVGGVWEDKKHRPIVCLIKSSENNDLYWAIPMGKYNHRNTEQIARLNTYLNYPDRDIRSCYYHIGRTTSTSIFFVSDAIPITQKYILEEHVGGDNKHFVIKNPNLIRELERKLFRILSDENSQNNKYRQHITDVKNYLLNELKDK